MLVRCKVESCFSLEALQSVSEPAQYLFAIGLKMDASLTAFHLQGTAQKTWNVSWCAVPIVKSVEWSDTAPCKSYFAGRAMAFCCGWQSLWFAGPGCSFDFCRSRGVFTCLYRCKHVGTAQSSFVSFVFLWQFIFLRVGLFWRMFQKKTKHRYLQYVQVVRLQLETELRWVGVFVQRCVCLKREGSNCIPLLANLGNTMRLIWELHFCRSLLAHTELLACFFERESFDYYTTHYAIWLILKPNLS